MAFPSSCVQSPSMNSCGIVGPLILTTQSDSDTPLGSSASPSSLTPISSARKCEIRNEAPLDVQVTMAMHRLKTPVWVPLEETNTLEAMKDWFRKTLSGRRCVLVVDNCSSPEELQPFLETGLVLLVTANGASSPGNIAESIRGAAQCTVPLAFGELVKRILSAAAGQPLTARPRVNSRVP